MFESARRKFRLAVISLLAVLAQITMLPFALWRFLQGDLARTIIDALVALVTLGGMLYAWRGGSTRIAGAVMASLALVAATVTAFLAGAVGLHWFYAATLAAYLLMPKGTTTGLVLTLLVVLWVAGTPFASDLHRWTFTAAVLLTAGFAYAFAWSTEANQRALERLATLDPLTGVGNRRALDRAIARALAQARRDRSGFALAMLDLDHFKQINDAFGHEAGDQVLADMAAAVRETTRKSDELFRFGGDEFVLLLSGVGDDDTLRRIGEKLCTSLASRLCYAGETIATSIGATRMAEDDTEETWLTRADTALYQAKKAGRNRVVILPTSLDAARSFAINASSR